MSDAKVLTVSDGVVAGTRDDRSGDALVEHLGAAGYSVVDRRVIAGEAEFDWIVVRNRIRALDNRNTREMAGLLEILSRRLGFRLQPGFSERVVYRELFFRGLTLLDLSEAELPRGSRASFRHARQEVADLVDAVATAAGRSTTGQTE